MQTVAVIQEDAFGAPVRVGEAPREVRQETPQPARQRRKVHETQREAHREILPKAEGMDARVLAALEAAGVHGLTRNELHEATKIKLQTVCGCVDRLMKASRAFEPVVGFEASQRALHLKRGGAKVVVAATYRQSVDWMALGRTSGRGSSVAA